MDPKQTHSPMLSRSLPFMASSKTTQRSAISSGHHAKDLHVHFGSQRKQIPSTENHTSNSPAASKPLEIGLEESAAALQSSRISQRPLTLSERSLLTELSEIRCRAQSGGESSTSDERKRGANTLFSAVEIEAISLLLDHSRPNGRCSALFELMTKALQRMDAQQKETRAEYERGLKEAEEWVVAAMTEHEKLRKRLERYELRKGRLSNSGM